MLDNILNSPFLYSLSVSLFHFIWQGSLIALALKAFLILTPNKKSQLRYLASSIALLLSFIAPAITFFLIYTPKNHTNTALLTSYFPNQTLLQPNGSISTNWYSQLNELLPFVSIAWLIVVCILATKVMLELRNVNNLTKLGTAMPSAALIQRFQQLVNQLGLRKKPQLLLSLTANVPMAIGWLKPVVLIPASMVSGLAPAQLEMLMLHELAHIRRHDYLVNFLQTLIEILFFFHPAIHWISKQIRNEREYCSDDIAVHHCGNPIAYARTLADTASICNKHRHASIPTMAMAASGGDLKQRVVRLVEEHHCTPKNQTGKFFAAFTIVALLSIALLNQLTLVLHFGTNDNANTHNTHNAIEPQQVLKHNALLTPTTLITAKNATPPYLLTPQLIAEQLKTEQLKTEQLKTEQLKTEQLTVIDSTQAPKEIVENTLSVSPSTLVAEEIVPAKNDIIKLANNTNDKAPRVNTSSKVKEQSIVKENSKDNSKNISIETKIAAKKATTLAAHNQTQSKYELREANTETDKLVASSLSDEVVQPVITKEKALTANSLENSLATKATATAVNNTQPLQELTEQNYNYSYDVESTLPAQTQNNRLALESAQKLAAKKTITAAKLVDSLEPRYPFTAKRQGIELDVLVDFAIDSQGRVKNIKVKQTHKSKYFRSAIKSAVSKWRFIPAQENGKAIESRMSKIFSFSLA